MNKYLKVKIKAIEDIKMGSQGSQKDNEYALSYIAGSAVRGAYIGKYIREKKIHNNIDKDEVLRHRLLNDIKFLNAYPYVRGRRSLPFPVCFYGHKEEVKRYKENGSKIKIINEMEEEVPSEYKRILSNEFCLFDDSSIEGLSVEKIVNLHVTTREAGGNLFRYEAIKRDQTFEGIIVLSDFSDGEIKECVETLEGEVLYLGGSKGSGYGRCKIEEVEIINDNPEIVEEEEEGMEDDFFIYAASDIISRNEFGEIIGYIDEKYLERELGIENVSLVASSIQTQVISGYNNKWGCRTPQIMGIKSGSVFKYSFNGILALDKIKSLQDLGIGDRLEEGYGRILILSFFDFETLRKLARDEKKPQLKDLNYNSRKHLQVIVDNIYKNRALGEIDKRVIETCSNMKNKLKRNQIGKLVENSINARGKSYINGKYSEEGKKFLEDYFNHIIAKDGKAMEQFKFTSFRNKNGLDFFEDFIKKSDDIKEFESTYSSMAKTIDLRGIKPQVDKGFVFNFNMMFLEKLCRYLLMKAGE